MLAGNDRLGGGRVAGKDIVRGRRLDLVDSQAVGSVALGIDVDQEDGSAGFGQADGRVDAGGGFTHAALLVCHNVGFSQNQPASEE